MRVSKTFPLKETIALAFAFVLIIVALSFVQPLHARAQALAVSCDSSLGGCYDNQGNFVGNGSGVSNNPVSSGGNSVQVVNPLGVGSFCALVKAILTAVIDIGIPISVFFIVFAGFKFVLARGNSEKLKEARQNFLWTIIGIAIFLGAWLLASVVANTVNALQAGSGNSSIISCR